MELHNMDGFVINKTKNETYVQTYSFFLPNIPPNILFFLSAAIELDTEDAL